MGDQNLILSRRDVAFLLYEWLHVEALVERERYKQHSRETFDSLLELSAELAADHFQPVNRVCDLNEPTVDAGGTVRLAPGLAEAVARYTEAGLTAACFDEQVGGSQLPYVVGAAADAWFQAASVGASAYSFLARANANLLVTHGTPDQVDTYARPVLEGRWFGTMCLSEPQAGSSLADITTKAEPQGDGTYRLSGTKMWISAGEHPLGENIVHLVLAKVPGSPAGVKGISLFVVPKFLVDTDGRLGERNDIALVGLNHKMGYRGTTNTLLNFGEGAHTPGGRAGAVGYLVGSENQGLALMFTMMNEARIGVGLGAVALGYTGYLHSVDYARSRTQGRPLVSRDATQPMIPIIEHADVRRMLLAQKAYVEGGLALSLFCASLVDDANTHPDPARRNEAELLLDVLTPIAKSWPSQWCLAANDLAIQVHGGSGYTRDFPVEQFYRDNRLNPIHEGTHGIQALDLLGRRVIQGDGAAFRALLARIDATVTRAGTSEATAAMADALATEASRLAATTEALWAPGDPALALANAWAYLEAFGHVVVAWLWLEQVLACGGNTGRFYDGKRTAAAYFYAHELPLVGYRLDLLDSLDRTVLDADPSIF